MIDSVQILLFFVITTLTILLVIIGWQIFQILIEVRKMLIKFNTIIDNSINISGNISKSIQDISGFAEGFKAVFSIINFFKKNKENE